MMEPTIICPNCNGEIKLTESLAAPLVVDLSPVGRTPARCAPRWMTLLAWAFLCCLFLIGSGCTISPERYQIDPRVHAESDISANFEQARLQMRGLVQPMSGVIVASANQILAGTSDPAIRREALRWKIEAVPALREALFQPNPMTALGDAWVLTFQMTDYFESGPGAKALGEARAIAVTASQRLEAEMARVAASVTVSGDVSRTREYVRKWAADHPIQQSIAGRESILSHIMERELAASFSPTEAVGNLVVSVDDLNRRLEIYSAQLLDQSRWQAELFLTDFTREHQLEKAVPLAEQAVRIAGQAADDFTRIVPVLEGSLSTLEKALPLAESAVTSAGRAVEALDRTIPAVERSLAVVEKAPALVAAEREAAMKALSAELRRTLAFFDGERLATLKQLDAERKAVVQDLAEGVAQERKLLAQDIDGIALKAVDRAFLRAAQLCAAVLVAVFFSIIVLMLIARRVFFGSRHAGWKDRYQSIPGPV